MAKYEVNDAIWIATALMAADVYFKNPEANRADMYFKQSDIVHLAQEYAVKNVDPARVSWWVNADSKEHTQNYLRADSSISSKKRRLSMMNEFPDKTYPTGLDMSDNLSRNGNAMTIAELFAFVREKYPSILATEAENKRKTFLISWNAARWEWKQYKEWCAGTKQGKKYSEPWTCKSKQPAIGDEVFLVKLGEGPRGVLAHGQVVREAYQAPHYDVAKAADGETTNHIDVEFDWIQDYETEEILLLDELNAKLPDQKWNPQGGGIEISESVVLGLHKLWEGLIDDSSDYWPPLAEYSPGFTSEQWLDLLKNQDVTPIEHLRIFKMMLKLSGESTCANLAETYGRTSAYYNRIGTDFGQRVHRATGCPLYSDDGHERFFTIPFVGRAVLEKGKSRFVWKMRAELKEALEEMDLSKIDIATDAIEYDKNIILFGPPGTGKTYSSSIYAVAICDGKSVEAVKEMDYKNVMARYRELLHAGRIAFTTFHQSYGYEEFIEGIKPVVDERESTLGYAIEQGIFKRFCESARIPNNVEVNRNATVWLVRLGEGDESNSLKSECFQKGEIRFIWDETKPQSKSDMKAFDAIKTGDYVVSYHGKGTDIDGIGIVLGEEQPNDENLGSFQGVRKVNWLASGFIENIKSINGNIYLPNFKVSKLFRINASDLLAIVAEKCGGTVEKNEVPFVFIIDEINRGNISKIFGELITLIEPSRRDGTDEQIAAILPYSGESFSVPENVYLLGTMNTADRSIALMDTALRRRFRFIEMMPDENVLDGIVVKDDAVVGRELNVSKMLKAINERITFLYDREHTIGHAFFMSLQNSPTVETLAAIFQKSIIPLLQEYFYEDYQKIQLVLGDNGKDKELQFIQAEGLKPRSVFKGDVGDAIDLPDRKYSINEDAFGNLNSYIEIM